MTLSLSSKIKDTLNIMEGTQATYAEFGATDTEGNGRVYEIIERALHAKKNLPPHMDADWWQLYDHPEREAAAKVLTTAVTNLHQIILSSATIADALYLQDLIEW